MLVPQIEALIRSQKDVIYISRKNQDATQAFNDFVTQCDRLDGLQIKIPKREVVSVVGGIGVLRFVTLDEFFDHHLSQVHRDAVFFNKYGIMTREQVWVLKSFE